MTTRPVPDSKKLKERRWVNDYVKRCTELPEYLQDLGLDSSPTPSPECRSKFSRFDQHAVEFGFGSGGHLIDQAKESPATLFFGFEKRYKRAFRAAEKAKRESLHNIFFFRGDIEHFFHLSLEMNLVLAFMNFPDPWDRKRWKKHRMINSDFLRKVGSSLSSGGSFIYKSDHRSSFEETKALVDACEGLTLEHEETIEGDQISLINPVGSEFESLFRSKKVPFYVLRAVCRSQNQF